MSANQQVTEGKMSDENQVVEKLHIQALIDLDTDWAVDKPTLQELIEDHIMFQSKKFTNFYKTHYIIDKVHNILYDSEDDKLGRIRDVYDNEIQALAKHIANNYENDNFCRWAFQEVIDNII